MSQLLAANLADAEHPRCRFQESQSERGCAFGSQPPALFQSYESKS